MIGSALYFRRWMETNLKKDEVLPDDGEAVGGGPAFEDTEVRTLISFVSASAVILGLIIIFASSIGWLGAATRNTCLLVVVSGRIET